MKIKKAVAVALILFTIFVINVIAIGLLSANDSISNIDKAKNLTITPIDNKNSTATSNTQYNNQNTQSTTVTQTNQNTQPTTPSTPTVVRVTRAS